MNSWIRVQNKKEVLINAYMLKYNIPRKTQNYINFAINDLEYRYISKSGCINAFYTIIVEI